MIEYDEKRVVQCQNWYQTSLLESKSRDVGRTSDPTLDFQQEETNEGEQTTCACRKEEEETPQKGTEDA